MTLVRRRTAEYVQVRNLSPCTEGSHIQRVSLFAHHLGKLGWSRLSRQPVGELKVDFAVVTPVSPRDSHLGRLPGSPDHLDLGRRL